ncbi:MAG: GtrA family protein [Minisyncoccia bacterium]|jgi:dolichol-phosphate mannosyltransferase
MKELFKRHQSFLQVGLVGAMGAVIQSLCLFVLVEFFGIHPVLGNTIAAEIAVICNFIVNNFWTFRNRSMHSLPKRFVMFNISVLGSIVIQAIMVSSGIYFFGVRWYLLYAAVGIVLGLILNYTLYVRLIWKYRPDALSEKLDK